MNKRVRKDRYLNANEVGELLSMSASAVYAGKCGTERLTRIKKGRKYVRWSRNEVLDLITQQLIEAQAEQAQKPEPTNLTAMTDWMTRKPKPRTLGRDEVKAIFDRHRTKGR